MAIGTLPDHFFISGQVMQELHTEKTSGLNKNSYCFYILYVKKRSPKREFYIDLADYSTCQTLHQQAAFRPGVLASLQPVQMLNSTGLTPQEYLLKIASIIATNKVPETTALLVTPQEKATLDPIAQAKKYSIRLLSSVDILQLCGVDYPFRSNFMEQLNKA